MTTENTATQTLTGQAASPVGERVARLSAEFGDDAPRASWTRVLNIQGAVGLDEAATLALLDEAAAITRSQAVAITKRGRAGEAVRMPYLLATLRGLIGTPTSVSRVGGLATAAALDPPTAAAVTGVDDPPATTAADTMWRAVRGELRRDLTPENYARWVEATTAADTMWRAVRGELRRDLTPENYARWVEATTAAGLDGDLLRVGVPDEAHRQWLEHKLRGCVERALGRADYGGVRIVYDVVTPGAAPPAADRAVAIPAPSPLTAPSSLAPTRGTPAEASVPQPRSASIAAPVPVVACPTCRATPCRCRLADQLRRAIATRVPVVRAGAS